MQYNEEQPRLQKASHYSEESSALNGINSKSIGALQINNKWTFFGKAYTVKT